MVGGGGTAGDWGGGALPPVIPIGPVVVEPAVVGGRGEASAFLLEAACVEVTVVVWILVLTSRTKLLNMLDMELFLVGAGEERERVGALAVAVAFAAPPRPEDSRPGTRQTAG